MEQVPAELLWIPIALLAARLFGVVERWGQPAVLGELLAGILLGNLALIGIPFLVMTTLLTPPILVRILRPAGSS